MEKIRERERERDLQANRSKFEHEAPTPPACKSRVPPAAILVTPPFPPGNLCVGDGENAESQIF